MIIAERFQEGISAEGPKPHASNVSDIVMSMQSQDITRQRLEKVMATIQEIQKKLH